MLLAAFAADVHLGLGDAAEVGSVAVEPFGEDVLLALAATALHPALRRALVFGASPEELDDAAGVLERMLAAATDSPVRRITLAAFHSEDQLWGIGAGLPDSWRRPGLLVGGDIRRALLERTDLDLALIPAETINDNGVFLDDESFIAVRESLPMPVYPSYDFVDVLELEGAPAGAGQRQAA